MRLLFALARGAARENEFVTGGGRGEENVEVGAGADGAGGVMWDWKGISPHFGAAEDVAAPAARGLGLAGTYLFTGTDSLVLPTAGGGDVFRSPS